MVRLGIVIALVGVVQAQVPVPFEEATRRVAHAKKPPSTRFNGARHL